LSPDDGFTAITPLLGRRNRAAATETAFPSNSSARLQERNRELEARNRELEASNRELDASLSLAHEKIRDLNTEVANLKMLSDRPRVVWAIDSDRESGASSADRESGASSASGSSRGSATDVQKIGGTMTAKYPLSKKVDQENGSSKWVKNG
jgi:hypothetical protein